MTILNLADEPQHIPTLAAWHHHEWSYLNPGRSLENRIEYMQGHLGDEIIPSTFIYLLDEQLAGSAAIVGCDMDTRPELTPWLASVFVHPQFRQRGIASELIKHTMRQAKLAGIAKLYLFTPDQADFYRKLGWQRLSPESYHGYEVTLMHIPLQDKPDPV